MDKMEDLKGFRLEIIEIIGFSRLVSKKLSVVECIRLHQWVGLGILPSDELRKKCIDIKADIKSVGWKLPKLRYDELYKLWYYDTKKEKWIKVVFNEK